MRRFFVLQCFCFWRQGSGGTCLLYTSNHYLQTLQIEEGIPKKRISCARLEEELRESFEDITWVSVRLHGTRLFIRLRESEVPVRQEVESGETCDLAAVSDARITSVVVRSGIPLVQAGDTVEKGQLLVSGTVPILSLIHILPYQMPARKMRQRAHPSS